jgi:hypothetical protein
VVLKKEPDHSQPAKVDRLTVKVEMRGTCTLRVRGIIERRWLALLIALLLCGVSGWGCKRHLCPLSAEGTQRTQALRWWICSVRIETTSCAAGAEDHPNAMVRWTEHS